MPLYIGLFVQLTSSYRDILTAVRVVDVAAHDVCLEMQTCKSSQSNSCLLGCSASLPRPRPTTEEVLTYIGLCTAEHRVKLDIKLTHLIRLTTILAFNLLIWSACTARYVGNKSLRVRGIIITLRQRISVLINNYNYIL